MKYPLHLITPIKKKSPTSLACKTAKRILYVKLLINIKLFAADILYMYSRKNVSIVEICNIKKENYCCFSYIINFVSVSAHTACLIHQWLLACK